MFKKSLGDVKYVLVAGYPATGDDTPGCLLSIRPEGIFVQQVTYYDGATTLDQLLQDSKEAIDQNATALPAFYALPYYTKIRQ
jgi:hypothetical protein